MKFVDETIITVSAGCGGKGALSFRREKFLSKGGPDGGNGGRGGNVILVVEPGLNTLADFRYRRVFQATHGSPGSSDNRTGASGENREVKVPMGTLVFDLATNELIVDMVADCQKFVVAYGGKGGAGNAQFKSSTNRTPRKTVGGKNGDSRQLRLEIQILADVGLLGLPNAGKSTLLQALSNARPKIGEYPFTTLYPQLGVVEDDYHSFVMADIPGLIEGAAAGAGLGTSFLRHLRRTRLLLHLVDIGTELTSDVIKSMRIIEKEIKSFDKELAARPRWVVLNKADCIDAEEVQDVSDEIARALPWTGPLYVISAITGDGCKALREDIFSWIATNQKGTYEQ